MAIKTCTAEVGVPPVNCLNTVQRSSHTNNYTVKKYINTQKCKKHEHVCSSNPRGSTDCHLWTIPISL